jgi:hypothetical protein
MWNTVVAAYRTNPLVHFEPMNEPFGVWLCNGQANQQWQRS